jgi:hypothetical protein
VITPEVTTPAASDHPQVGRWRAWPDMLGNRPRGDRMMDGTPLPGPDGRVCWPHGDHVHCR